MVSKISSNSEILKCRAEGVKVIGNPVNSHALELNKTKPRDKRSEIRPSFSGATVNVSHTSRLP